MLPDAFIKNAAPVKIVQPKIFNKEKMRYVYEEAATPADIVEYADNVEYQKVYSSRPKAPLTQPPLMQLQPMVPITACLLYTSPSPRDGLLSRMPSSA